MCIKLSTNTVLQIALYSDGCYTSINEKLNIVSSGWYNLNTFFVTVEHNDKGNTKRKTSAHTIITWFLWSNSSYKIFGVRNRLTFAPPKWLGLYHFDHAVQITLNYHMDLYGTFNRTLRNKSFVCTADRLICGKDQVAQWLRLWATAPRFWVWITAAPSCHRARSVGASYHG